MATDENVGSVYAQFRLRSEQLRGDMQNLQNTLVGGVAGINARMSALLGVGLMAGFAKSVLSAASALAELKKQADAIGVTTDELQQLHHAASQAEGSAKGIEKGMQRFSQEAYNASRGTGALFDVFRENNIALRDAQGNMRPVLDMFMDFADLVKNAPSNQQLGLVGAIFGRRGAVEMIGLLKEGSAGLRKLMEEAKGIVSPETIKKADELDDRFNAIADTISRRVKGALVDVADVIDSTVQRSTTLQSLFSNAGATWEAFIAAARNPDLFRDALTGAGTLAERLERVARALQDAEARSRGAAPVPGQEMAGVPSGRTRIDVAVPTRPGSEGGATRLPPPDAFLTAEKAILAQIAAMEAQNTTIRASVGEQERYKTQMQIITQLNQLNIPITDQLRERIDKLSSAFGKVSQASAAIRLQTDLGFERSLVGLTDDQAEAARRVAQVYGIDVPEAYRKAAEAAKAYHVETKQMQDSQRELSGMISSFIKDLRSGDIGKAFTNLGERFLNKQIDMFADQLAGKLTAGGLNILAPFGKNGLIGGGGGGTGIGGIFGGLFGGGSGAPVSTGVMNVNAGMVNMGGAGIGGGATGFLNLGGGAASTSTGAGPGPGGASGAINLVGGGAPAATGLFTRTGIPLSSISAGGLNASVASQYAPQFQGMLNWLQSQGYNVNSLGGYSYRNIAGTNTLSRHAFGEAIDVNPSTNPHMRGGNLVTDMPAGTSEAAARFGLKWGGDWRNPDAMHFQVDKSIRNFETATVQAATATQNAGTQMNNAAAGAQGFTGGVQTATTATQGFAQGLQSALSGISGGGGMGGMNLSGVFGGFNQGPGDFMAGGIATKGGGPHRVNLPAVLFANAPHFKRGGVVHARLHENEEVITTQDPRHRFNGGRGVGRGGDTIIQIMKPIDAEEFSRSRGTLARSWATAQKMGRRYV